MFKLDETIPRRKAQDLIEHLAKYGNHYLDLHGKIGTIADIKRHYEQNGRDFDREVQRVRAFKAHVFAYENLIGPQWATKGVTVSKINPVSGQDEQVIGGDGTYNDKDYWQFFELSVEDFTFALQRGNYERFLSSINHGIAAIEGFLNYLLHTRRGEQLEPGMLRETLEDKLAYLCDALKLKKFDKSQAYWRSFKTLKAYRDDEFQHNKRINSGITFIEMERRFNGYSSGIAMTLMKLHVHFSERCPAKIIRYAHLPQIRYVVDPEAA